MDALLQRLISHPFSLASVNEMLDVMTTAIEDIQDNDISFADIRRESFTSTDIMVVNGNLRRFGRSAKAGTIARALVGECWGMASTSESVTTETCKTLLSEAIKVAKANARFSRKTLDFSGVKPIRETQWQQCKVDPETVSSEEKLEFVKSLDKFQQIDDRIVNRNSLYNDTKKIFQLVNTAGSELEWDEIRIRAVVQPVAREANTMQFNFDFLAGKVGYELIQNVDPELFCTDCAKGAIELLSAEKPPSGTMTVIADSDISGLIAHEVCGHASEADEVVKKRSFLTDMVGKKIGTDHVTMVDDGTIEDAAGSYPFDSEGTPASRTVIIENGVYKGYMHTLETAILMGVSPTGNGRAQDYNRRIFARMSNTFFDVGDWSDEEIIVDTKDGLYVNKTLSGMEDVVSGGVQCSALKGYIIKNGEITQLVRSMTLAGKVLEILKTVDAVGKKLQFSGGNCGKGEEDFIPVTSGGPHMRMEMVVGGG
ncbi:TldD/PmbA family protein [Candidatus Thorarchaeota archaeon]|nr:MAG: TldD/PmbA family protein [Candidatus Thorarchaeota archaeon]